MKVAVIGAGIIGITTAYELAMDGHEVTVFERRSAAAEETSFANAGIVAPGYVTPWAAPGMPGKVLSYLLSRHAPRPAQLAPVNAGDGLDVEVDARLQTGDLPRQPGPASTPGFLQPPQTAPADGRAGTGL